MTIEYIRTNNETYHISIYNYENKFCYWVSIIQRLHTSPTLNQLLRYDERFNDDYYKNDINYLLMFPIKIYADLSIDNKQTDDESTTGGINADNILKTYTQLKNYFNAFIPKYVNNKAKDGYVPRFLLTYFYCPTIYKLYPNQFIQILNEIHISKINFDVSPTVAIDIITASNPFLINEFDDLMVSQYQNMMNELKNVETIELMPFVSTTLECFPNKDHTGGHAITLFYGNSNIEPNVNTYFIIDDQRTISKFSDYYRNRNERIYELSLRDINDVIAAEINKILHEECNISPSCKFSARITQYVLCFEHNFLSATDDILKNELRQQREQQREQQQREQQQREQQQREQQQRDVMMNQFDKQQHKQQHNIMMYQSKQTNSFKWFMIGLIVGVIVSLLINSIHNLYYENVNYTSSLNKNDISSSMK